MYKNYSIAGSLVLWPNYATKPTLAVMPECRKKGVARSLILEAERMFSNAGLLSVWCVERTGNVEIFEALGFKVTERIESDIFELADSSNVKAIEVRLERQTAV
ncbi:GNAT family N-acetyltransferase [Vibrio parahaemolyticus]|uniref:GNAT family N-acetyltransferase n=1 Tax=Vibrio parahaemolyticus TaxID=670 RepID=UPI001E297896|nr:GNAT family N-acetyltransferase [Vibrio parahaemolyticus]